MFIIDDLMALFAVGETAAAATAATATAEAIALAEAAAAAEAAATAAAATEAAAATTAAQTAAQTAAAAEAAAAGTQVPASFFEQQLALNPSTMTANPGAGLELASNAPGVNAEMDAVMRFGQNAPKLTPTAPVGPAVPSVPAPTAKLASYGTQPASQFLLTNPTTPSPFSLSNSPMSLAKMPMTEVAQPGIFDSVKAGWGSLSPLEKGAAMYFGASKLGMFDQGNEKPPADEPMSMTKYRLSDNFQPSVATPRVYKPDYTQYAAEGGVMSVGGVTSYAGGGTSKSYNDSLEYYKNMLAAQENNEPTPDRGSVGIYRDTDQDTRYQDALTAAQIRQSKINKRANLQMPTGGVMQRPTPMGQLNLSAPGIKRSDKGDLQEYAGGGITGSGNLDLSIPLDIGSGGGGGYGGYGGGGSYPFANSGGAAQTGFTGQNNAAGGGYANPFASSAGAGAPPSGPGMNLDPQGIFSDTFESKNVGAQNIPAGISQLISVLGGKTMAQGNSLQQQTMDMGPEKLAGLQKFAAGGGIMGASNLGGYAAGGNPRLLRGPGDGMSDNIPATIGNKQPARLADGEFVIPADVVSHLGNGSTEAGAKRLHEMMTKVRSARTGNSKQGKQINANKYMPK